MAFWIALAVFLLGVAAELVALLALNAGHFAFTLDDAYIHLAMAENIAKGHYGVNLNEFSSPCSSILWPFLLAPFALVRMELPAAFLLNILSAVGTLLLFWKILAWVFEPSALTGPHATGLLAAVLVLLIPATNMIGLVFTGMEHSLQVFLSIAIVFGLLQETRNGKVPPWLIAAIIAAPLVRYENLAMSVPALLYLFLRRHRKTAVFTTAAVIALVDAFSVFLALLGLEPYPTSVIAKSPIVATSGSPRMFLQNLAGTFRDRAGDLNDRGILLLLAMGILAFCALQGRRKKEERLFAASMVLAALMHVCAGRYGWYCRYEIYIWTAVLLSILYLFREKLSAFAARRSPLLSVACAAAVLWAIAIPYFGVLLTTPLASNNIHGQHFQMHRFAVEFYKKRVAVNDLGYVAYRNPYYVLDLWGLGSLAALNNRLGDAGPAWMNQAAEEHDVRLAMIYDVWFPQMPPNWRKVAELQLPGKRITAGREAVQFYALDPETADTVRSLAPEFEKTLPKGVTFRLFE